MADRRDQLPCLVQFPNEAQDLRILPHRVRREAARHDQRVEIRGSRLLGRQILFGRGIAVAGGRGDAEAESSRRVRPTYRRSASTSSLLGRVIPMATAVMAQTPSAQVG